MQTLLGRSYSLGKIVAAFLFWDSIGNSNWYLFAILFLYLFTWLSFRWTSTRPRLSVCLCFGLTLVYCLVLFQLKETRPGLTTNKQKEEP